MIEINHPDPQCDMHAGTVVVWDPDDPDVFAIRIWRSFSARTLEYEGTETHWRIDRESTHTYLIRLGKRYPHTRWNWDLFNTSNPRGLLSENHIREARHTARVSLGMSGPYHRLELTEMFEVTPPIVE